MSFEVGFFNNLTKSAIIIAINQNLKRLNGIAVEERIAEEEINLLLTLLNCPRTTERSVWRHPSSSDWWSNIYPNLTDQLFVAHFRVDRRVFNWLVEELRIEMTTQDTNFRDAISVERKVAVSLKCLATTCDFLTIASLFGIGRSSVHRYFLQFVYAVYSKLVPKVIKFPSMEEIKQIAREFETLWGFPMAFAAIDGTHIPFNPPTSLATDFYNYKGWSSILAIAMCDAKGKAIWLKCGMPGRMSDSGAFKNTSCYRKLQEGDLLPQEKRRIVETDVPFMVLGDAGFAMEPWLLKPFTHHGTISEKQKVFNYRHSRARRSVENMFGPVKLRWRRLLRGLDVKYENAHKVIDVAFALHNICENYGVENLLAADEISENQIFENRFPQPDPTSNADGSTGAMYRNALMEYFSSQTNPWTGNN